MNILLEAIEELKKKELLGSYKGEPLTPSGLIDIEDAIDALQKLEVAVRSECECNEVERIITDKAY